MNIKKLNSSVLIHQPVKWPIIIHIIELPLKISMDVSLFVFLFPLSLLSESCLVF
jgi:hypothetical protein